MLRARGRRGSGRWRAKPRSRGHARKLLGSPPGSRTRTSAANLGRSVQRRRALSLGPLPRTLEKLGTGRGGEAMGTLKTGVVPVTPRPADGEVTFRTRAGYFLRRREQTRDPSGGRGMAPLARLRGGGELLRLRGSGRVSRRLAALSSQVGRPKASLEGGTLVSLGLGRVWLNWAGRLPASRMTGDRAEDAWTPNCARSAGIMFRRPGSSRAHTFPWRPRIERGRHTGGEPGREGNRDRHTAPGSTGSHEAKPGRKTTIDPRGAANPSFFSPRPLGAPKARRNSVCCGRNGQAHEAVRGSTSRAGVAASAGRGAGAQRTPSFFTINGLRELVCARAKLAEGGQRERGTREAALEAARGRIKNPHPSNASAARTGQPLGFNTGPAEQAAG